MHLSSKSVYDFTLPRLFISDPLLLDLLLTSGVIDGSVDETSKEVVTYVIKCVSL